MDSGLLTDGLISSQLGQIQELISPAQNYYNSFFVQLQRRMSRGLSLQFAYTFAKSIMLDGMDFNNQFDFSNTHAPSLLDQRHRLSFAAVYQPRLEALTSSGTGRALLSSWTLSSVMEFSSGRPYAGLLAPASSGDNLNDTAFNQDTAATAGGINGAGPTPGIGLNSFYGPWLERIDVGLARDIAIGEGKQLQFQAQAFNLFNHANYYVQNGDGINQIQYNPVGTTCGDGMTPTRRVILCRIRGRVISGLFRKSAPTDCPACCSFRRDSLSSFPLAALAAVHSRIGFLQSSLENHPSMNYDAILVVSFGGPESKEEVIPFLENVLRGRNIPRERMLTVAEHYYHFEGKSPINQQTRELIAALEAELERNGPKLADLLGKSKLASAAA